MAIGRTRCEARCGAMPLSSATRTFRQNKKAAHEGGFLGAARSCRSETSGCIAFAKAVSLLDARLVGGIELVTFPFVAVTVGVVILHVVAEVVERRVPGNVVPERARSNT